MSEQFAFRQKSTSHVLKFDNKKLNSESNYINMSGR